MNENLPEQIALLPTLNKAQLLTIWAKNLTGAPPQSLRKELMVPILAYRLQEVEFGGLSPRSRSKLQKLIQSIGIEKSHQCGVSKLSTGTKLVRSWNGALHEVTVLNEGFEYQGKTYRSLSTIARQITGTRWSGPLFFGMRKRKS